MAVFSNTVSVGGVRDAFFCVANGNSVGKKIMSNSGPIIAALFALTLLTACAAGQQSARGEFIYGQQIMTVEELTVYRQTLAAAETELDRQFYVDAHHEKMAARAEEQGIVLAEKAVASKPKRRQGKRISSGSRLGR